VWSKIFAWIAANIALPMLYKFAEWYTSRPKVIESAAPGELEEKGKAKAKEDGFDVKE
jgi:hypothetical protein